MSFVLESCSVEELCIELGGTEQLLIQLRDKLRDWLKLQPHLPQDVSEKSLEWFILNTKMSLERAKQKVDMYYTMRRLVPEFFRDRDPRGRSLTSVYNEMQLVILPKLTPQKERTFIFRITETDPRKFHPLENVKYMLMMGDIRMIAEDRSFGDNIVFDLKMMSMNHLVKVTPTLLKKFEIVALKAYGSRIKGIHLINAPLFVDRIVAMIKSLLKSKLTARIHVHSTGNSESFYRFVPKSILPKDYGGNQPTMKELSGILREKMIKYRDWFVEQEKIVVDERLRPGQPINGDQLFGFSGSFRKLEVD